MHRRKELIDLPAAVTAINRLQIVRCPSPRLERHRHWAVSHHTSGGASVQAFRCTVSDVHRRLPSPSITLPALPSAQQHRNASQQTLGRVGGNATRLQPRYVEGILGLGEGDERPLECGRRVQQWYQTCICGHIVVCLVPGEDVPLGHTCGPVQRQTIDQQLRRQTQSKADVIVSRIFADAYRRPPTATSKPTPTYT